jgi:hypothetical protein
MRQDPSASGVPPGHSTTEALAYGPPHTESVRAQRALTRHLTLRTRREGAVRAGLTSPSVVEELAEDEAISRAFVENPVAAIERMAAQRERAKRDVKSVKERVYSEGYNDARRTAEQRGEAERYARQVRRRREPTPVARQPRGRCSTRRIVLASGDGDPPGGEPDPERAPARGLRHVAGERFLATLLVRAADAHGLTLDQYVSRVVEAWNGSHELLLDFLALAHTASRVTDGIGVGG